MNDKDPPKYQIREKTPDGKEVVPPKKLLKKIQVEKRSLSHAINKIRK